MWCSFTFSIQTDDAHNIRAFLYIEDYITIFADINKSFLYIVSVFILQLLAMEIDLLCKCQHSI